MNEGGLKQPVVPDNTRKVGCGSVFLLTIILTITVFFAVTLITGNGSGWYLHNDQEITSSTVVREPLPEGSVNETGYYTDELGVLLYESEILPGLKNFYSETGVQPYVYLTNYRGTKGSSEPTKAEMRSFAESKYNEMFTDDAHLLLVLFQESGYGFFPSYNYWYVAGRKAESVIDTEAGIILGNYIDKYYYDDTLSYEQFFSKVFDLTANHIMSVNIVPGIMFLIVLALAAAALLFAAINHVKKKKQEEARRTEEILKTPLEKFSDKEDHAEKLARNYDNDPNNDVKL